MALSQSQIGLWLVPGTAREPISDLECFGCTLYHARHHCRCLSRWRKNLWTRQSLQCYHGLIATAITQESRKTMCSPFIGNYVINLELCPWHMTDILYSHVQVWAYQISLSHLWNNSHVTELSCRCHCQCRICIITFMLRVLFLSAESDTTQLSSSLTCGSVYVYVHTCFSGSRSMVF